MEQLIKYFGRSSAYHGDNGNWQVLATQNRDSNCLERANWDCMVEVLKSIEDNERAGIDGDYDAYSIERAGHYACGWIEYLIINPASAAAVAYGEDVERALADYPVLDDERYSQYEHDEADQVWRDCYNTHDRIAYIRDNRAQFEFYNLRDIIDQFRGEYFGGYASVLIA